MTQQSAQRIAYHNGRYVPEREVLVPFRDRSFLFGDGCFDVTRTFNGRPFKDPFLVRAAGTEQAARGKVLVVVFQRGGMDGLNVVVPFKDHAYYALRPSIAVGEPAPGEERAHDLHGFYARPPARAPRKSN